MKHRPQFYFQRPDAGVFAFAALWSQTDTTKTCVLITTEPNGLVGAIHDRMPVILKPKDYGKWLDPATDPFELNSLLVAVPDDELTVKPEEVSQKKEPGLFD